MIVGRCAELIVCSVESERSSVHGAAVSRASHGFTRCHTGTYGSCSARDAPGRIDGAGEEGRRQSSHRRDVEAVPAGMESPRAIRSAVKALTTPIAAIVHHEVWNARYTVRSGLETIATRTLMPITVPI